MKSSRTLVAFAALAILFPCVAARAQTGSFMIITGPGTGAVLNAVWGVVNGPGAGTNGPLIAPNAGCPGTQFHYHGLLAFAADPAPAACGWGQINFPMLPGVTIGLPATVPAVPLRIIPTTGTAVSLTPTTAMGTIGVKFDPSLAAFAPLPQRRTLTTAALWSPGLQQIVAEDDARHAAKYVPMPGSRRLVFQSGPPVLRHAAAPEQDAPSRTASPTRIVPRVLPDEPAWQTIEMTGPQAKPTQLPGVVP